MTAVPAAGAAWRAYRARVASLVLATLAASLATSASAQSGGDAGAASIPAPQAARDLVEERATATRARRDAITKMLIAMDDRAVAALVGANRGRSTEQRAWAAETLEAMGRERADEQIRTRSDDVLAGIFAAYGEARDPDALGVLSSFIGIERASLREAARAALVAYGGEAISTLRQDYADLTGEPAAKTWNAEATARALFAASDKVRLRDVNALLERGLAHAREGDLASAVTELDAVLARHDGADHLPEIARAYAAYARSLEDSDPERAREYFARARHVAPDDAPAIDADLLVLDAQALEGRGLSDETLYRRAIELDPTNVRARAALDRLMARATARQARLHRWVLLAVLATAALLTTVLFVGRRRPKARSGAQT